MAPVVIAMLMFVALAGAANAAGTPERGGGSPRHEGRGFVARQPSRRAVQPTPPGRAGSNAVLRGRQPRSPVRQSSLSASTIRARAMLGAPHASRTAVLGGAANARTVLTSTVDGTAHRRRF
jgi:hypothetical protein